ncbi:CHAT domain-containing protein [Burkholderia pseudomallei]|uniref:CHAT domain-containing protein n=1 Tax=Burkholderia pseudomallei TaxID=28450 RepID=UPI0009B5AFBC|nr:CHAT domain-containing protein [Burkholderia pseudomallei]MWA21187.1 CHAT domain-containing protein [Burkholderia pseudomallei]MWA27777.1 CHAT domain-containing protein [Burkholderia pseudomallei]VCN33746.1 CHAT domain [Burkholderia pseudomallei]VCN62291.1 CHAT domain [Burkholderia pseudomallei]
MNTADFSAAVASLFDTHTTERRAVDVVCVSEVTTQDRAQAYLEQLVEARTSSTPVFIFAHADDRASFLDHDKTPNGPSAFGDCSSSSAPSVSDQVDLYTLADLQGESLLRKLSELPSGTVAVVLNAGDIRFAELPQETTPQHAIIRLAGDHWVAHVVKLVELIERTASLDTLRIVLDVGHNKPNRKHLIQLLERSSANKYFPGSNDVVETIDDATIDWDVWARDGLIGNILQSIDRLSSLSVEERAVLKAQLFLHYGITAQAIQEIEEINRNGIADTHVLVELARIACDSGALLLARDLLNRAADTVRSMEALEVALTVAWLINDPTLASQIALRLQISFPLSELNIHHRLRAAHAARDYSAAASEARRLKEHSSEAEAYLFLCGELPEEGIPNYPEINRRIKARPAGWSTLAQDALVRDALSRGLIIHALEIVEQVLDGRILDRRSVLMTLDAIEQITIARSPGSDELVVQPERLIRPLTFIVRYLANVPSDTYVYSRLRHLLSVEGSGRYGEAAMTYLLVQHMNQPRLLTSNSPEQGIPLDQLLERRTTFGTAFTWLSEHGPTIPGRTRLPRDLFNDDPRPMLASITQFIGHFEGRVKDDLDIVAIRNWLALGLSIAPYVENTLQDLRMLYAAAGILARSGRPQEARDFCRQSFILAGEIDRRRRLAWTLNADIYKTGNDTLSSLIAIACAQYVDCALDPQDAWQEANLLTRIFRDLGLFEPAMASYRFAGEVLQDLGTAERMKLQHRFLGLTVMTLQTLRGTEIKSDELKVLLSEATSVAEIALTRNDSRGPIISLLGQIINAADTRCVSVSQETRETFERLKLDDSALDPVVVATSAKEPTIAELLSVHLRSERARYAADAAYDVQYTTAVAARFLSNLYALRRPEDVVFAIELLADRAVAQPGWRTSPDPVSSVESVASACAVAAKVSAGGTSIVMAGLDNTGTLVRVDCVNGSFSVVCREKLANFSRQALLEWSKQYPYAYADDNAHANVFYLSTERLKFSELPASPTLVVASTALQALPLNLWRIDQAFAGLTHAMVSVPSLSWLRTALTLPTSRERRKRAWISARDQRGATLVLVADRLMETFSEHNIELDSNDSLPSNFIDAKLAIVTAHGGIAPGGKSFFTRISDEGELSITGRELSKALRNVEVVILFVCSGGRADKDPSGDTVSGMAKQLFDAGCSAVIASPWPLDPRVTYHWLPTFLAAWKDGSNLAEANFRANQKVDNTFPGRFTHSLAMHVFGNPFIKYD